MRNDNRHVKYRPSWMTAVARARYRMYRSGPNELRIVNNVRGTNTVARRVGASFFGYFLSTRKESNI